MFIKKVEFLLVFIESANIKMVANRKEIVIIIFTGLTQNIVQ